MAKAASPAPPAAALHHLPLATVGREFYPGYAMPLAYQAEEALAPDTGQGERFRLVLVERGTGIVRLGRRRLPLVAPALLCLDEVARPALECSSALRARALYFHPTLINSGFSFAVARGAGAELPVTDLQDLHWLRPFLGAARGATPVTPVGPGMARRLARLFDATAAELAAQRDDQWPCRSRTFFLELLFLVERACSTAAPLELQALEGAREEVDRLLLHLATHYAERITIAGLTRTFHTNRTTLTRTFSEVTGLPVIAYLNRLRIHVASLMLRDTLLPVAEVMERVGFSDLSHFGRTFRRQVGCPPSEYRRRTCWMLR